MRYLFFFIIVCFNSAQELNSQSRHDNIWILNQMNVLDFSNNELNVYQKENAFSSYGPGDYSTSICDQEGNLLFFGGGCHLFNKEYELLLNGDSINSEESLNSTCGSGDFPAAQANLILPHPFKESIYYYLNQNMVRVIEDEFRMPDRLFCQTIDMDRDEGRGEVIVKNEVILSDTLSRGYVQATSHSNGVNWWIITNEYKSNCFYISELNEKGFTSFSKQCTGNILGNEDVGGQIIFSPDGRKLARINSVYGWELFDFDNTNGIIEKK